MSLILVIALAAVVGALAGWRMTAVIVAESGAPIAGWVAPLATALLCGAAGWRIGWAWELPVYVYFAIVSIPLTVIDRRTHRLPNPLTLSAYPIVAVGLAVPAVAEWSAEGTWDQIGRALLGGVILLGLFGLLHLVNPAGMGLGDVKLSGPMGALLAWISWSVLLVGTFAGFVLGALTGLTLIALGRAGRKSALAFGPFMLAGAWLAIILSPTIEGLGLLP